LQCTYGLNFRKWINPPDLRFSYSKNSQRFWKNSKPNWEYYQICKVRCKFVDLVIKKWYDWIGLDFRKEGKNCNIRTYADQGGWGCGGLVSPAHHTPTKPIQLRNSKIF